MPPPTPVLQANQTNNTDTTSIKLEENGGAKHIDPKLIEMITSEVIFIDGCCRFFFSVY